jgi:glycosyltransferase involved in cell wall biosynthesis
MKVAYFDRTRGACDYYRAVQPLQAAVETTDIKLLEITALDLAKILIEISRGHYEKKFEALAEADVVLASRPGDDTFLNFAATLKKFGTKVVVDYDDNIFDISPFSPHYEDHGLEDVNVTLPDGTVVPVWKVGKNLDADRNRKNLDAIKRILSTADLVTTTTPILADVFRQYTDKVAVLPNCINLKVWDRLPLPDDGKIRLAWFGGSSHYEDWCLLAEALPVIMAKYPNVTLVLMGHHFKGTTKNIPQDRIEFHRWVDTAAYPYKAARLNPTIGLIPLADTRFNRCKSPIKWIEMGALQVPCITSYVSPYAELATEENGVFVDKNDPNGWVEGISYLIENPLARAAMGAAARKTVAENFDIHKNAHRWTETYKGLLSPVGVV